MSEIPLRPNLNFDRTLVCAPKNAEEVKRRWPSRPIEVSPYCQNDLLCVMRKNKKGIFIVDLRDNSVWQPDYTPRLVRRK